MVKVALLDDYQNIALEMADWGSLPDQVQVQAFQDHLTDQEALVARLADFDIVMAMRERTPFPRALLERLPKLACIASAGQRNAVIDLEAATDLGILVCGTSSSSEPTIEFTWAALLSLIRHIPAQVGSLRDGTWQTQVGVELNGKTLGIIGLGRIGSRVAEVARAFRMTPLAWSPHLTPERAAACGAEWVELDALLSRSDFVTVHMKLAPSTRGLLGARELALLKPSAYLLNNSRGPLIDEAALLDVLQRRAIAGAALDVFDVEPLPAGHPLLSVDNVLLTPHLGGMTWEHRAEHYLGTLENIKTLLAGETPERVFNEAVLSRRRPLPLPVAPPAR